MQATSSFYNTTIVNDHTFEVRININGVNYEQDVIFSATSDCKIFDTAPTIGGVYSGTFEFRILGDGASIPKMAKVIPYFRIKDSATGETSRWIKKGEYFIDTRSVTHNENGLTVFEAHCFDAILKANANYASSSLSWPAVDTDVVADIASKIGVAQDSRNASVMNKGYMIQIPTEYTMRDVLSYIGTMYAANWIISDIGELRIVPIGGGADTLSVGKSCANLNVSPQRSAYTKVVFNVDEQTSLTSGSSDTNVMEVYNPMGTQAEVNNAFSVLSAWQYQPFEASGVWSNPAVELGDQITVVGKSGTIYSRNIRFGAGMVMTLSAPNDNYIDHEYEYKSPEDRRYERAVAGISNTISLNSQGITLLSEKINNIGGRNLLENTLEPSVVSEAAYPKIVGGQNSVVSGTPSTAEHGIRTTAGSAQQWLYFGLGRSSTMNGLVAGETYTLSADLECKMLSDLTSGSYPLAVFVYVNGSHYQTIPITTIDTTTKGTVIAQQVRVTFTVPTTATSFRLYIRCQSSSASFAAVGDYIELANLKLERGEIATAWTPAPEDQVGNDEIIAKINVSPGTVQIAANKISLAGKTIDLTSDTIQITSTNFSVNSAGVITATGVNLSGTFNMTGGSINILTSSGTQDYISLGYNGVRNQMSPYSLTISENNHEKTTSIERGRIGVSHYVTEGSLSVEKITSSLGDGSLQLGCASSGYSQAGYLSIYGDTNNRTIYMNGSSGTISATNVIKASNGTAEAYLSPAGSVSLSNGTNTASISSTLAYWYNGSSSKYTALMWPDSNGAGRIILGDGTSTVWRVSLTNDGLTFRDASDNVTAQYPAVYSPPATTTGTLTFLSGWTMADGESDPNVLRYTFLRKNGNVVELCVSANTTSSHSGWNTVCTLPSGFRPSKTFTASGYNNSDDSNAIFRVTTSGEVLVYADKRQPTLHTAFVI